MLVRRLLRAVPTLPLGTVPPLSAACPPRVWSTVLSARWASAASEPAAATPASAVATLDSSSSSSDDEEEAQKKKIDWETMLLLTKTPDAAQYIAPHEDPLLGECRGRVLSHTRTGDGNANSCW